MEKLFEWSDLIPGYGLYKAAKRHGEGDVQLSFVRNKEERIKLKSYMNKSEAVAFLLQLYNAAVISGTILSKKKGLEELLK